MSQTKRSSFYEACINTTIGFIITLCVSPLINWHCNIHITYAQMGWSTIDFTIVSVIRSYVIRRWFNKKEKKDDISN